MLIKVFGKLISKDLLENKIALIDDCPNYSSQICFCEPLHYVTFDGVTPSEVVAEINKQLKEHANNK